MGRYPSGQRGQTVNLLALVYVGSNPTYSTKENSKRNMMTFDEIFCFLLMLITAFILTSVLARFESPLLSMVIGIPFVLLSIYGYINTMD